MTFQELAELLRYRRAFLKIRQEDLAEMSGVNTRTIHQIENGTGNPSFETLEKLTTVMGLEIILQVKKPD